MTKKKNYLVKYIYIKKDEFINEYRCYRVTNGKTVRVCYLSIFIEFSLCVACDNTSRKKKSLTCFWNSEC